MNFEELYSKFIAGTITPVEMVKLADYIDKNESSLINPNISTKIDSALTKEISVEKHLSFMEKFGKAFINAKFAGAVTGASVVGGALKFANFGLKLKAMIAIGSLAVVTGGTYLITSYTSNDKPTPTNSPIVLKINNSNSIAPSTNNEPIISQKAESKSTTSPATAKQVEEKGKDGKGIGSISETNNISELVIQIRVQLSEATASHNSILQAELGKKLGILYKQLNRIEDSRAALNSALMVANTLQNNELKGEIVGELSLLEIQKGNRSDGLKLMNQCLELLKSNNSTKLGLWQDRFAKSKN